MLSEPMSTCHMFKLILLPLKHFVCPHRYKFNSTDCFEDLTVADSPKKKMTFGTQAELVYAHQQNYQELIESQPREI